MKTEWQKNALLTCPGLFYLLFAIPTREEWPSPHWILGGISERERTFSALKGLLLDKQCCTRSNLFEVLRAIPVYSWVVFCLQNSAGRSRWAVEQTV